MAVGGWSERLAPDILRTWRRFPLAVPLQVLATLIAVAVINDWLSSRDEFWARAFGGLVTGAAFSVAGNLFAESRPDRRRLGFVLAYVVRATTPGDYFLPGAWASDMYRPAVAARTSHGRLKIASAP